MVISYVETIVVIIKAVADLEGVRAGSAPPPRATDRRRHRTPDKWKRYCIIASARFLSFYC